MKSLTVLVDMDDTIENFCYVWIQKLNQKYGTNVREKDVTEWDMSKFFPNISEEQLYEPLNDDGFWDDVVPLDGAVKYLKKIKADGHKVFIVTASHPDTVREKLYKVLFRYFPFITYKDVIIANYKQMILGDVLIDDAPHNLVGGQYKKILYNRPHNRSFNAKEYNITRVDNWKEIYKQIKKLAK